MRKLMQAFAFSSLAFSGACLAANSEHKHSQGPFDLAIANPEKLMEMLKKSGKIGPTATAADAEKAVTAYLKERQDHSFALSQTTSESSEVLLGVETKSHKGYKLPNKKGGIIREWLHRPAPVELEAYEGEQKTARVLALLIEFPDFPHNTTLPGETDMYYPDYTAAHYKELLFSKTGYEGPNGEDLISMVQFYEAQSGGSYSVEGDVAGWYMASQPAAYYGNNVDGDARALVTEALMAAAADPSVDLSQYDIEDRYDLDGDGDLWEPDGLVDHLMIFHSSVGEEAGGGQLGEDAVWAHRWNLGSITTLPGTSTDVPYWDGLMAAYDYTIQPVDAAAGVCSHEYGHDLGLPDEYDTNNTGRGEPVSYWSVMSSGSWGGLIPGSEPTGFSAWAKEFLQNSLGGNWLHGETFSMDTISWFGEYVLLDQAVSKGKNNDAIRIDLPDKEVVLTSPTSGEYAYFSGSDNDLNNAMFTTVDLTAASSAELTFKAWYDIEADWDYAYLMVDAGEGPMPLAGNITTNDNPNGQNPGEGITGSSEGWIDATFDLSAYVGQEVVIYIAYYTDSFVTAPGLFADDIVVTADGEVVLSDDAESTSAFELAGFELNTGKSYHNHYYLVEWRTHQGVDVGLSHILRGGEVLPFNEGMIVWYVDDSYDNNWVGLHPGDGFLGVVDADQRVLKWSDGSVASTSYQVHDAAFNTKFSQPLFLDLTDVLGATLTDNFIFPHPHFIDRKSYISDEIPDAGRNITDYGLNITVLNQSWDGSVAKILIRKSWY